MGAMVDETQMNRVLGYIEAGAKEGARLAFGGKRVRTESGGYYIEPTVFDGVKNSMKIAQEEIFGPVLVAMPFDTEAEAIALANATQYGLVAGVWTRDGGRQLRLAKALQSGQVFVNDYGAGGGVELPFGGVKKSGHGREKGWAGLLSFTTLKTVAIKHG
jgi:aldehyde dehydrogenase (NAD+)